MIKGPANVYLSETERVFQRSTLVNIYPQIIHRSGRARLVLAPEPVFPAPFPARTGQGRVRQSLFPSRRENGTGVDS